MADEEKEIPTNYTREYAVTRGWGDWEMVREFSQNSLDATGTVSIEIGSEGLLITDKGKGFNAVNLLMGTSTKSECDRGRFGEGLKIACLAGLNLGYSIEIDTDSMHITPVMKDLEIEEPSSGKTVKTQIMAFRYRKIPAFGGTRIKIKGYGNERFIDRFNLETNKIIIHKYELDKCLDKKYKSYMIAETEKRIYVRNIYVQSIPEDKKALYSYDLFKVRLSTDRNIPNSEDIFDHIGRLWSTISNTNMIVQFFKNVREDGYEKSARLSSHWMGNANSGNAWKTAFRTMYGNAFLYTDENESKQAEYHTKFQMKSVYLPSNIRSALATIGVPTDVSVLRDIKNKLPGMPESYTDVQTANLEYLRMIHYKLKDKHFPQLKKVFLGSTRSMIDVGGKVIDGNIYVRQDLSNTMVDMLDVYGHEATHVVFPNLEDNTSEFYAKIGHVMAIITKVVKTEPIVQPEGVVW